MVVNTKTHSWLKRVDGLGHSATSISSLCRPKLREQVRILVRNSVRARGRGDQDDTVSFGDGRVVTAVNSQQPWLSAQDQTSQHPSMERDMKFSKGRE